MIQWGRPIDRPENRVSVRALALVNLAFTRLYHRLKVLRPPHLPARGPAILVSNHISGLDPLLIQSCCSRLVVWMTASEYFVPKPLRWVLRSVEAIPVDRQGRDFAATRASLRSLKEGRILGVFPEGKIAPTRELLPFHVGVALLAVRANVPVYPVYLDGTQRTEEMDKAFGWPNRSIITFGPPVQFDRSSMDKERLEEATQKIRDAIKILAASVRRGV